VKEHFTLFDAISDQRYSSPVVANRLSAGRMETARMETARVHASGLISATAIGPASPVHDLFPEIARNAYYERLKTIFQLGIRNAFPIPWQELLFLVATIFISESSSPGRCLRIFVFKSSS
jgi:hypothetical protein